MATLILEDGTQKEITPANGKTFSLKELQGFVGGYIELVFLADGRDMYVNEEGKLNGLKLNQIATILSGLYPHDVIVGPAIVCTQTESGNDE